MKPLHGKAAIVTGASRGIGAAIALRLGRQGAAVIVNYLHRQQDANLVVDQIRSEGGMAHPVQADVSLVSDIRRLFDEAEVVFGPVRILVNNAGVALPKLTDLSGVSEDQFDHLFSVNCRGVFMALREAAHRMPEGSRIVNLSTTIIPMALPGYSVYAGTKAAVEMFTRIMSKELAGRNITVNAVSPGPVETELFNLGKTEEAKRRMAEMTPLKRLGKPDDIAATVAFLVGEDGGWVNGQIIRTNGGIS
jgi:3-oxoacyl-[acyl-carrier protein] reductase